MALNTYEGINNLENESESDGEVDLVPLTAFDVLMASKARK